MVAPKVQRNLLSISRLTSDFPCYFIFTKYFFYIKDLKDHKTLAKGIRSKGLYLLPNNHFQVLFSNKHTRVDLATWHKRLGYPGEAILKYLLHHNKIVATSDSINFCNSCHLSKSSRLPFSVSDSRASRPLEKVHSDLWGPSPVHSHQGFRFYVLFVDDYSHFTWICPLKQKSDLFDVFVHFRVYVEKQFGALLKTF